MKLSEMRQLLAQHGVQLTKSLGQNFLHDANQLRRIAAAAELTKADRVLEIGPGLGPLTALLIHRAGEVLAIEKDARLVSLLEQRFSLHAGSTSKGQGETPDKTFEEAGVLHLIHADALDYLRNGPHDWRDWKLVSNLPYSVGSPILVDLAQAEHRPKRLVATLQVEVARRLMAQPGDKDYGVLTLLIQMHYQPGSSFKIPASCFFPAPEVDSACVTLLRREPEVVAPSFQHTFVRLIKRGFSQRRKMMSKLLKADWSSEQVDEVFRAVHLSPHVRAEAVGLEQFAQMARHLHSLVGTNNGLT
jgi:16S rRNA (adenine1518-N6/adenine1519-N6)-dimethyltransferase